MEFYNQAAGKNRDRLAALSDGVFAVALTLIVLDIRVPSHADIRTDGDLLTALGGLVPQFATYVLSFLTLGIFWVGQQTQLNVYARTDRDLTWLQLAFLAAIATLPFSTSLLSNYITLRAALVVYWLNILVLGVLLYWSWRHATKRGLVREDMPARLTASIDRRIIIAQSLYAVGAALCAINTYWSIGFIILVQFNYALAPRIPILYRL